MRHAPGVRALFWCVARAPAGYNLNPRLNPAGRSLHEKNISCNVRLNKIDGDLLFVVFILFTCPDCRVQTSHSQK